MLERANAISLYHEHENSFPNICHTPSILSKAPIRVACLQQSRKPIFCLILIRYFSSFIKVASKEQWALVIIFDEQSEQQILPSEWQRLHLLRKHIKFGKHEIDNNRPEREVTQLSD